jgi:ABC-type uncharacterized transport system substrate-binding protein
MNRRRFVLAALTSTMVTRGVTMAQDVAKIPRIGVLLGSPARSWVDALRQGLRDAGLIEDRSVHVEWRSAHGHYERLPALARELVGLGLRVLIAHPTVAVKAVRDATASIPIVMPASADPIGAGLVQSLARPGGNITGSTFISSELAAKRLEVLKQLAPRTKVVAVLANPGNPAGALQLRQAQSAAGGLGVRLTLVEVGADTALAAAFAHVARDRAEAVLVVDDPVLGDKRLDIIRHIDAARLPAIYGWRDWVDAGGLVSLGANVDDMFRRAAGYVDRILKGARPADLPIEQPTIFEFVINLKTAKALGLTIPPSVLARVDQVIE